MTSDNEAEPGVSDNMTSKVKHWLSQQGYPTEFKTALRWQSCGFRVFQGFHVRTPGEELLREVDVLATRDSNRDDRLIRVAHVIECKWSKDKPWVVFTSKNQRIGSAACIAQTIGNSLGSTLLWMLAGDEQLRTLKLFETPQLAGFGGRQAFSKGLDNFFSAMKSVASLSTALARDYDSSPRQRGQMPELAVIVLPIIVVDGLLFEAFFDESANDIRLSPSTHIRCHWCGSSDWQLLTTIDIVTLDSLEDFVSIRSRDLDVLFPLLDESEAAVATCFKARSLTTLKVKRASRGILGLPPLLAELHTASQ